MNRISSNFVFEVSKSSICFVIRSNPSSIEAAHIPYDPKPVDGAPVIHGVPVQTV